MSAAKKKKSPMDGNFNVQAFLDFAGVTRTIAELQVKDTTFPHYLRSGASSNSGKPL